jgi:hypothetical protein
MTNIEEPRKQAYQAIKDMEESKAEGFYRSAVIAAHEAPELTNADRTREKLQLRDDFSSLKKDLGRALVGGNYDLADAMRRAIPVRKVIELGDPAWDEVFGA